MYVCDTVSSCYLAFRRRSFFAARNVGQTLTPIDVQYGDGFSNRPIHTITSINIDEDWTIAEAVVTYTYPHSGPLTFRMGVCCRVSTLINNANSVAFGEGTVDLRPDSNGKVNSSPTTSLSPIIDVLEGTENRFSVVAQDPDGDTIKYSLAINWDGSHPAAMSMDEDTGEISFTPGAGAGSLYSTQVAISCNLC